jgi:hypothetical protein
VPALAISDHPPSGFEFAEERSYLCRFTDKAFRLWLLGLRPVGMLYAQGVPELDFGAVDRNKSRHDLPAPQISYLDQGRCQLVLLSPVRLLVSEDRCVDRESLYEGQQPSWTFSRRVAKIEAVVPLKIGLDKAPAIS